MTADINLVHVLRFLPKELEDGGRLRDKYNAWNCLIIVLFNRNKNRVGRLGNV